MNTKPLFLWETAGVETCPFLISTCWSPVAVGAALDVTERTATAAISSYHHWRILLLPLDGKARNWLSSYCTSCLPIAPEEQHSQLKRNKENLENRF
jgi:hypothetical protein